MLHLPRKPPGQRQFFHRTRCEKSNCLIIIAQENGYFTEQGLELEVIAPADPADPPKLVAAGKADLAISYQPQLHLQVHAGLPWIYRQPL